MPELVSRTALSRVAPILLTAALMLPLLNPMPVGAADEVTADFSADVMGGETGTFGLPVTFSDESTGPVTTWSWDFGDGSTSSAQNPSHVYRQPGTYTVELTVSNASAADTLTRTGYIEVWENLSIGLTPKVDPGLGTVFGPGFDDPRMITDGRADTYALVQPFDPNNGFLLDLGEAREVAQLKIKTTKATGLAYHPHFRVWARASGADPWTVVWQSSGSSSPTPNNQLNTIAITNPGPWRELRFSVAGYTAQSGAHNTNWWEAQVWGPGDPASGPRTDFSADVRTGPPGMTVAFSDRASGSPTAWEWDFGDGSGSTAQNPTHVYSAPGQYTVKLTTTSAGGLVTSEQRTNWIGVEGNLSQGIHVTPDPAFGTVFGPGFNDLRTITDGKLDTFALVSPPDPNNGVIVDLGQPRAVSSVKIKTTKATGLAYHPHYTISGRMEAVDAWTTLHTSSGGGTAHRHGLLNAMSIPNFGPWRYLRLQVSSYTSQSGAHNTNWWEAQVFGPGEPADEGVRAHFSSNLASGSSPATVSFTDASAGATGWSWNFGDGTTATDQHPVHAYPAPGNYDVRLTVTGAGGAQDSSTASAAFGGTRLVSEGASVLPDPGFGTVFTGDPQNITDGSHTTYATVAPPDPNNGFIIDLGMAMPVTGLKIKTAKAGGAGYHPHYTISGRETAGDAWTTLHTSSGGGTAHRNNQLNTVSFPNHGPWRYVRVQLSSYTSQSGQYNSRWYTAEVYGVPPRGWVPLPQRYLMGGPNAHQNDPTFSRAEPVNTRTGVYWTTATDLRLPGRGLGLSFDRTYSSGGLSSPGLGAGWTHNYAARLIINPDGSRNFVSENGAEIAFLPDLDGGYTAPAGVLSSLARDGDNYALSTKSQRTYRFDAAGRLVRLADRNDNALTFAYAGDDLTTITDTVGRVVTLSYDGAGRLTGLSDPLARTVGYGYDLASRLATVTDLRGGVTTYAYDAEGRLASISDPNGHPVVRNTYDADGRIIEQLDALDELTTFGWDPVTLTSTMTDARGGEWVDVYLGAALVEQRDPLDNATTYAYDAEFNRTTVTDPRGHTTTMTYDDAGNLLTRTAPPPLSYGETFTYTDRHDLASHTNGRGHTTTYEYDAAGNLVRIVAPGSTETVYARDPAGTGLLTTSTDPRDKTTTYAYDADANLVSITSPEGRQTTMDYDGAGRLTSSVDPRGNEPGADPADFTTAVALDEGDLPTTVTDPLGNTIVTAHDAVGKRISVTDPLNETTVYAYDDANRLRGVTDAHGETTGYAYDAVGNLVTRSDANAHVTSFEYDLAGRMTATRDPLDHEWVLTYDAAGNLLTRTDAKDQTTTYTYDALNRPTAADYADPGTPDVGYVYDANGNLTQLTDGAGAEAYTYDQLDRLTAVARGSDAFGYAYDPAGNLISRTYPDATVMAYAYGDDGLMTSAAVGTQTTTYAYDAAGNPTQTATPDGVTAHHAFDEAGRLLEVANLTASGTLSRFTYGLDAAGRRTSVTTSEGATGYEYDALGRLTEACYGACPGEPAVPTLPCLACTGSALQRPTPAGPPNPADTFVRYTYDPVSNRLSEENHLGTTTSAYDAADRLTGLTPPGSPTETYAYDANGNQTAAGADSFVWNATDRIVSATVDGTSWTYAYAGDGRRLSATSASAITDYTWDINFGLPQLVLETTGSATRRYTYGLDLIGLHDGSASSYLHTDGLGSVVDVTDAAGASMAWSEYAPFGTARLSATTPSAPANPFAFTGEYLDTTGLYHLRARQYDPSSGRFLSTDPVAPALEDPYVGSYVYVRNTPLNAVDPSGEFLHIAAGFVVGAAAYVGGSAIGNVVQGRGLMDGVNLMDAGLSGLGGAMMAATAGMPLLYQAGVGTVTGMATTVTSMGFGGRRDPRELALGMVFGMAGPLADLVPLPLVSRTSFAAGVGRGFLTSTFLTAGQSIVSYGGYGGQRCPVRT